MKKLALFITIIFIFLLSASGLIAADASMFLSPSSGDYFLDQPFNVDIMINTDGEETDSADAILYYEPQYLELVDYYPAIPGIQNQPGSTYELYPGNEVDLGLGRIRMTGFSFMNPFNSSQGGPGMFARMTFKGRQFVTGTPVFFEFNPGDSHDSNVAQTFTSADILSSVSGGLYNIIPDTFPPYITNLSPANNATNVSPSTNVSFHIKDDQTAVDIDSVVVIVDGVTYTKDGANKFAYSGGPKDYYIRIDPPTFDYEYLVNVHIEGSDLEGNSVVSDTSFLTAPKPENYPPVLGPLTDKIVYAGSELIFMVTATDPNPGDTLTITMSNAPDGATLTRVGNGRYLFTWQTDEADLGSYQVSFRVRDNGDPALEDFGTVNISVVEAVPVPPTEPFECPPCPPCGERTECSDNIDNDGDGLIDYSADPQCSDYYDDDELTLSSTGSQIVKLYESAKQKVQSLFIASSAESITQKLLRMASPDGNAYYILTPPAGNYYPGQEFSINVLLGTDNFDTNAADLILFYDPLFLQVVDYSPAAGVQVKPGSLYESYPLNTVDPVSGKINVIAFSVISTYNSGSGTGVLATVTFEPLQVGNTNITFDFTPGETIDSNVAQAGTGVDILSSVSGASINIIPDAQPPYITSFTPPDGATNRNRTTDISFRIKDDETAVDIDSVVVRVEDTEYRANVEPKFSYSGTEKDYAINVNLPTFSYSQTVDIYIDAEDTEGNTMPTYYSLFQIMDEPVNNPPVLQYISDKSAQAGTALSFIVKASDADSADTLSYSLTQFPVGATITKISNTQALFEWTSPVDAQGSYFATVRVQDNGLPVLADEQVVTINIQESETVEEPPEVLCPQCPICPQCHDQRDNDGDGFIDYPNDPGCESYEDNDELDEFLPQCSDNIDNDGDGYIDYPYDPGCESAADDNELDEFVPQCSDGLDNDGDGYIDFPEDPGCDSAADNDETDIILTLPQCSDGLDNDGDGYIDYPNDPGCDSELDNDETDFEIILSELPQAVQELILDNPAVERAVSDFVAPILFSVALLNALNAGLALGSFLNYLGFLFTEPFFALFKRRKKAWGIVYDSLTKKGIQLAIVRLYDQETGKIILTRITDKRGRFFMELQSGKYYATVTHQDYIFPSIYLADETEDGEYLDLYFGGKIDIDEDDTTLTISVPLDPKDRQIEPDRFAIYKALFRKLQYSIAWLGVFVALIIVLIKPTPLMICLFASHLLLTIYFRNIGKPAKPKSWGVVRASWSRKPIARAVVRIFDKEHNKLLETKITNRVGRYGFLVNSNVFYLTASKPGYTTTKTKDIDLSGEQEEVLVAEDIILKKLSRKERKQLKKIGNVTKLTHLGAQNVDVVKKELPSKKETKEQKKQEKQQRKKQKNIEKNNLIKDQVKKESVTADKGLPNKLKSLDKNKKDLDKKRKSDSSEDSSNYLDKI